MKNTKKKSFSAFRIGYLLLLVVCITFWILVIRYVYNCLLRYEAAQPERIVEALTEKIAGEGVGSVFSVDTAFSRFEPLDCVRDCYEEAARGETVFWRQDKSSYDVSAPVYQIYAGERHIGNVTLRETSSEPLMFILSLSKWEVESAEPVIDAGQESVTVTAPDSCSILVNGVALGEEEFTGTETVPEQFQYITKYVDVPKLVEYKVEGLFQKPEVEILDAFGNVLEYDEVYGEGHTQITVDEFPVSEMDPQLEAMVLENAERYSNFFSKDLPGCEKSTKPIADMFPEDSYYMTMAETYRKEDMWMYNAHSTPSFKNESVSHYISYSDQLFSCEVYFDKLIPLANVNTIRTDTTHMVIFYGYLDGRWKILDMQTLLDSDGQ